MHPRRANEAELWRPTMVPNWWPQVERSGEMAVQAQNAGIVD